MSREGKMWRIVSGMIVRGVYIRLGKKPKSFGSWHVNACEAA